MFPRPGRVPAATSAIADLAAVVTVTDDGGSSGRLRQDFNMLPPGDLRNCMVALSEEEDLLSKLFTHRFSGGNALKGHNFGNLFVAALTEITGDFAQAVQLASKILATRGRIYPATTANATLVANMDDGSVVRGETKITASKRRIVELTLDPPNPAPLPETLEAIERADLITVGPGSLYTSLITNLLVDGIPAALGAARGVRVFICNLMTQANESLNLTASEHIERIYEHTRDADLRLRHREHGAVFAGDAGALRGRGRGADRCRHRAHRGAGRALHHGQLCQRRERGSPRGGSRGRRGAETGAGIAAGTHKIFKKRLFPVADRSG